ncbi:mitochondrial carrier [Sistotremastrum niveocremeum HHB9708]|uniref:Mitochondrial carrier n=1 Tax=Sistotremastrum niveocremeum HHB9708 TaxID=1314777 RepID=A0A164ZQB1_9AGAM|nr:mitochondrial carrier [Sistotremastrum niveocremeum HHB9708]
MSSSSSAPPPSRREIYEGTLSGALDPQPIPHLQTDNTAHKPIPRSLADYRAQEKPEEREARLRALWRQIPRLESTKITSDGRTSRIPVTEHPNITPERAEELRKMYADELLQRCSDKTSPNNAKGLGWKAFQAYADHKEAELWAIFHDELDLDGNGHLDANELTLALDKAGITLSPSTLVNFMAFLTSSPHSHAISFPEFRDFLLLMPRKASTAEIFRFYEVRRHMGDGRGSARVNMEGDVGLAAEDLPPISSKLKPPDPHAGQSAASQVSLPIDHTLLEGDQEDEELDEGAIPDHQSGLFGGATAVKFLLAGGIAGAISRTATAPFDRLKVYLITRAPELASLSGGPKVVTHGAHALAGAIRSIYAEGGVLGFWVGNGLNIAKIFPESAIKFLSYESSKRFFAVYWDHVEDSRDISGLSRFVSGGIGGITSQLSIYPIETLKTQMMSSTGRQERTLIQAAKRLWGLGGTRAYYRGLTIGLVGVFPYSAIDMSTFEALKLAYIKSTGKQDPGVLATLGFGSISGSVGATSVYPLNLVRTRLQASGSTGHPQQYTGIWDVAAKTMEREGWRGFYRGLLPTLAKVVPAVSISYVVYEQSKKKLGVA